MTVIYTEDAVGSQAEKKKFYMGLCFYLFVLFYKGNFIYNKYQYMLLAQSQCRKQGCACGYGDSLAKLELIFFHGFTIRIILARLISENRAELYV